MKTRIAVVLGIAAGFVALIAIGLGTGALPPKEMPLAVLTAALTIVGSSLAVLSEPRRSGGAVCCQRRAVRRSDVG